MSLVIQLFLPPYHSCVQDTSISIIRDFHLEKRFPESPGKQLSGSTCDLKKHTLGKECSPHHLRLRTPDLQFQITSQSQLSLAIGKNNTHTSTHTHTNIDL